LNIEEFKEGYIKRSNISREFFDEHLFVTACDCDFYKCQGFAVEGRKSAKEIKEFLGIEIKELLMDDE